MSVLVPQDNIQSIKSKYLRRLAEEFVQNIYASSEATALDLPTVPKDDDDYSVPSYITLCQGVHTALALCLFGYCFVLFLTCIFE